MENEGQRDKGESNNFVVSFYALCKDVVKVLDFMERLENEEDQNAVDIANQIEKLKLVLTFICTYVQLSHCDLEIFESVMSYSRQEVVDMDHVFPSLMDNINDCIDSSHHSTSSSTMTDEQLSFLLQNLHYLSKCYAEQIHPLETQYEILLNVCGNMKDFHGLIVNRCIEHEIVQYVLPQFQLMAEKVGIFLWDVIIKEDSHLLICHTNLKASTSAEVGCFMQAAPRNLSRHYKRISDSSTRTHEFLLIVLTDMPKDFIHHDKLFDLLARVGALIREEEIGQIRLIIEDVSQLPEKIHKNKSLIVVNSPKKPVERKSLTADKIIAGFEEEINWLISRLTSGPKDLDVISITGMPGSGKTTLAYKVYNDESVSRRFNIRAWCTVGQEYDKRNLLEKVYNQVTGPDSKLSENMDVADELRRHLLGKRYLIVLDDLWDTDTWDKLSRPFPLVENGSRIILTSRDMEVGLYGKRSTGPLNLRLLRLEESWELLEKRAFGNKSCPDELLDVGKEIAENCKGLPLVADLIAGVIAGREKTMSVWLEVRNNLNSYILNSEVDVMKDIELSYDHLPLQLKPCFLYLARYPKDEEINRDWLKIIWHTEGLVEQTEMKSVDELMEIYFDNLISSGLIISFNEIGDEPTCQIHDLVHDFCLIKAREENVFGQISSVQNEKSGAFKSVICRIDEVKFEQSPVGGSSSKVSSSKSM
ncbi:hypothetical protein P3S67_032620 [Capsicum chacoense]